ncbi:MBL fold metallo-hydrolase [Pseudomonas sp. MF6751]|uniref:MBL fold metallo-hydrolase n=1 Tax=Pseudomonas sp. MF6751 TaxID=2797528 RepID=UPI0019098C07|nr:MBL fold metallo-hydrolase [Pseudomonas sp. MF6751]MBK3478374.1 MBL fold metallo-hydrolase [Pseudomonas sp. MF6751]
MRRNILIGTFLAVFSAASTAAAPFSKIENPGFYRIMLGDFEVTALSDGISPMPADKILINTQLKQLEKAMEVNNLSLPLPTSVNAYLINTGEKLVLVDVGTGALHGETLGKMMKNLNASGYKAEQVDEIYLTHLHPDHVGGLVAQDKIAFPNAIVRVEKEEVAFWLNEETKRQAEEKDKRFFDAAITSLKPYEMAGKLKTFEGEKELTQGISAIETRGHTPGHSVFAVESKGKKMVILGDMIHVASVQFPDPNVAIAYDIDASAAVAQRKRLFDDLAQQRALVAGAHLSFPGLGYISRKGDGYDWHPLNYGVINKH